MLAILTNNIIQFQNDTKAHLKSLENQFSQLDTTVGRLQAQGSRKLPSQTMVNPMENVSAINLRSRRQLDERSRTEVNKDLGLEKDEATTSREEIPPTKENPKPSIPINVSSLPFLSRFVNSEKEESAKEMFDMFQKVHVNIPLLDAIK